MNTRLATSILALALLSGCAARPVFDDAPAVGKSHKSVLVESVIDTDDVVRATCAWKAREAGNVVRLFPSGANGCTYREGDRVVILWTDPGSFSNRAAMEVAGHEIYHRHNLKDHI